MRNFFYISDELINIYSMGIENRCCSEEGLLSNKRNIKRLLYCLALCIFSPCKSINCDNLYFINGKSQRKLNLVLPDTEKIYRGFGEHVYSSIRNDFFLLSPLSRFERLKTVVYALLSYKRINKDDKLSFWIDYIILYKFLKNQSPKRVVSRGHTDEYTTWFGEFSKVFKYSFEVYQHGVMGCSNTVSIPHKIYYSKFYAFDTYSIDLFKELFIQNSDCECNIYSFLPSVQFEQLKRKNGYIYIGIGEQMNEEWVNSLIDALCNINKKICIVIMTHPLSNCIYRNNQNVIIEKTKKYSNIDYFITENSTLAIDYYRTKTKTKIIFTDYNANDCFKDYHFIYMKDFSQLKDIVD